MVSVGWVAPLGSPLVLVTIILTVMGEVAGDSMVKSFRVLIVGVVWWATC